LSCGGAGERKDAETRAPGDAEKCIAEKNQCAHVRVNL